MTKFYTKDYGLSAEQLDAKYNPDGDGEHPGYTRRNWRLAVDAEETVTGYWDWVEYQLEMEEAELDRDNPYNRTGDDA
jgi:hypothetical protein